MTRVIVDAELRARLNNLSDLVLLCDETGRTLGYFHPVLSAADRERAGIKSPVSDAELMELRKQRTGRPLEDILKDLELAG